MTIIRPSTRADITSLTVILDATQLFPSEMLPEMIAPALDTTDAADIWLTALVGEQVIGFCFCAPEPMTEGVWNMLAIAIAPDAQAGGHGKALIAHVQDMLRNTGQRVLIVDTSASDDFITARMFYSAQGFEEAAQIKDYWSAGEDKITFWKSLTAP